MCHNLYDMEMTPSSIGNEKNGSQNQNSIQIEKYKRKQSLDYNYSMDGEEEEEYIFSSW